ncbi:MAG: hypothetical protein KKF79_10700 [Gammaproteobacteria bacterium]|nr:hypothetical protein [Gammaproteobacteria bacterium]
MLILVVLCITVIIYAGGTSGAFYYDDFRPLSQLQDITDWLSAAAYITSETSGPLGRPLSMLTFALQHQAWPDHSSHFFWFNLLLHAANGMLVYLIVVALLSYLQQQLHPLDDTPHKLNWNWTACFIAALWLLSPMQISTSLIAIQRMTGLSAFFVFTGILLYVYGLRSADNHLRRSAWQQLSGLVLFTILAVFSKENGILLPVLALVLEKTIFRQLTDKHKKIRLLYLWCCFAIVMTYLCYVVFSTGGIYPFRDFTMLERVFTQPYILITYLKLAFFPDLFAYNPFHDNVQVFKLGNLPWYATAAIACVIGLLVLAVKVRHKLPVLSFAILWFFAAHLLESTVIGLELYFEHRNYVALFGPCFALGWALQQCDKKYYRFVITGAVSYLILLALITTFVVQIWGKPLAAAEHWFDKQFGSPRAAEHLALLYLEHGQAMPAYFTLQAQVKACDECIGSRLQYVIVACAVMDESSVKENLDRVKQLAASQHIIGSAPSALASLQRQIDNKNCSLVTTRELKELNLLLLQHQTIQINASKHFELLLNLHQLAELEQNKTESLDYLRQAFDVRPAIQLGEVIFNNLLDVQDPTEAQIFQQQLCQELPRNLFTREQTRQRCEAMTKRLNSKIMGQK